MVLEAWSLCRPSASSNGQVPLEVFYTGPDVKFHFAYPGFHWLPVFSAHWIQGITALLALAGFMVSVGFCYRASALLVFLSWGYLYAIESTRTYWMSYHYLELLVTFLMIWMPAASRFSIDAWLSRYLQSPGKAGNRKLWLPAVFRHGTDHGTVPIWTLWLLRGQLMITYFYAGVAKLNADWLLDAQPVRYYLSQARWVEDYGAYLGANSLAFLKRILQNPELAYFISYAGAFFDLGVGFLLLCRRTRIFGMALMLIFHGTNHFLIFNDIEWFPLLGVLTALIFFDPDWPERFWSWLRHPRLSKPDWGWCLAGAAVFPGVGAALGWKLPARKPAPGVKTDLGEGRYASSFIIVWLVWQALMPARQYLISGDGRFTWEGLSFSWRLKAEVYRCTPCELSLEDSTIISRDDQGRSHVDWKHWLGEPVLYRTLDPSRVDWSQLPELIVTLEPLVGERILYNPFAGRVQGRSAAESRARVQAIWQEVYGHAPQIVLNTAAPSETLSACVPNLRARGYTIRNTLEAEQQLEKLLGEHQENELTSILRQTHPLALQGGANPAVPFLLIEDSFLARNPGTARMRIEPGRWKQNSYTHSPQDSMSSVTGHHSLVVYTGNALFNLRTELPQACLFDSQEHSEKLPVIYWNYLRELTYAQGMHMSLQPFLLREYARHVADLWEQSYKRRPVVFAQTAVSLNFRPAQQVVDPQADLASVPLAHLRHNAWIRQLECPRIPRGSP